jgi:hypothetical protein
MSLRVNSRQLHMWIGEKGEKKARFRKAPPPLEVKTHIAIADLLRLKANPEWFWSAFPAGEMRTKATAAKLYRMGVKAGVSDLIFIAPTGRFLGLEIKRGRLGRLSEAQEAFADWCARHGVTYAVADSYEAAVSILTGWGVLKAALEQPEEMGT